MASRSAQPTVEARGNATPRANIARGKGEKAQWKGLGDGNGGARSSLVEEGAKGKGTQTRARPTHFLALPLHNHVALRTQIAAFQAALFEDNSLATMDAQSSSNPPRGQKKVVRHSTTVEGLDSSIVIDPVRMHMTLGVMALAQEDVRSTKFTLAGTLVDSKDTAAEGGTRDLAAVEDERSSEVQSGPNDANSADTSAKPISSSMAPPKTVLGALALLQSLAPRISEILNGQKGVKVPLEVMDVLKTERLRKKGDNTQQTQTDDANTDQASAKDKVGAGVLFVGPKHVQPDAVDEGRRKLLAVCDIVDRTFREGGFITDTRPLKLHCTILNASHRKPHRRMPFSYTDILRSPACSLIRAEDPATPELAHDTARAAHDVAPVVVTSSKIEAEIDALPQVLPNASLSTDEPTIETPAATVAQKSERVYRAPLVVPPPLPVNLGAWDVNEIQLWVMGSRDSEGRYVSCGGVELK